MEGYWQYLPFFQLLITYFKLFEAIYKQDCNPAPIPIYALLDCTPSNKNSLETTVGHNPTLIPYPFIPLISKYLP